VHQVSRRVRCETAKKTAPTATTTNELKQTVLLYGFWFLVKILQITSWKSRKKPSINIHYREQVEMVVRNVLKYQSASLPL
jgi:hypothetical protein